LFFFVYIILFIYIYFFLHICSEERVFRVFFSVSRILLVASRL
jgi:hypothetical protein